MKVAIVFIIGFLTGALSFMGYENWKSFDTDIIHYFNTEAETIQSQNELFARLEKNPQLNQQELGRRQVEINREFLLQVNCSPLYLKLNEYNGEKLSIFYKVYASATEIVGIEEAKSDECEN